jgi:transposase
MKRLSTEKKSCIIALRDCGMSFGSISKQLAIPKSSCIRWYKLFQQRGSLQNKKNKGQPKKMTASAERRVTRLAVNNRKMSATEITQQFNAGLVEEKRACTKTIRRALHR